MNVGIRSLYFRVFGIKVDSDGIGRGGSIFIILGDEEEFRRMVNDFNIYEIIVKSIVLFIYGSFDIKKVIFCFLFGGLRKRYSKLYGFCFKFVEDDSEIFIFL